MDHMRPQQSRPEGLYGDGRGSIRAANGHRRTLAVVCVFTMLTAVHVPAGQACSHTFRGLSSVILAQDAGADDESEVPPADLEKYIAVYKAMQRDRSLTVEAAAAQQGMTLQQFRALEARVERDDAAMQHVRDELQAAARRPLGSGSPSRTAPQ